MNIKKSSIKSLNSSSLSSLVTIKVLGLGYKIYYQTINNPIIFRYILDHTITLTAFSKSKNTLSKL